MKEGDSKPPKLDEKSNLVIKKPITLEEAVSHPLELSDIIGNSGRWQRKILLLTILTNVATAWNHLCMSFVAYPVDHWCARPADANISLETWWSDYLPNATVKEKTQHSQCEMYFYNVTSGSPVKTRIIDCETFEYNSEFHSIVNTWNVVCRDDWLLSTSQTIYMLGFLAAVLISGHFADKWLPESPRWLLAKGNVKKALPILEEAVKANGREVKDIESKAKILSDLHSQGKENASTTTFVDLLRTPNLRMKTLCLYFIWAVIAFTYYGLSLNSNSLPGNEYVNFFLSGAIEIPSTLMCWFTLDRFGRKKPFFATLLLGGLACLACIFIPFRLSGIKTALAMVGKMFNSASFSIVYIFSSEIFPTVARNVGVGSSSTVARIGSAIAPFMRDLGNATDPAVPLVIFGVLSIISALIVLKMPETNNQPIPDSINEAENFGKKEDPDSSTDSLSGESPARVIGPAL